MKFFQILLAILVLAFGTITLAAQAKKLHILPDASGWEYQQFKLSKNESLFEPLGQPDSVRDAIKLGERSLSWLQRMNSVRDDQNKLQLTKPGDLKGIPIESPNTYSDKTITTEHQAILKDLPDALKGILLRGESFTDNPPTDEATYILWAKRIDRNYQTASRWKLLQPYLPSMEQRKAEDVRGFYFLSKKTDNVEAMLRSFDSLSTDKKAEVRTWLGQMCLNGDGLYGNCKQKVDQAERSNRIYEFYLKYLPQSQELWDSYFGLHNPRSEIQWTSKNPAQMIVPFQDPISQKILKFLQFNIEDEWKWDQWQLKLEFKKSADIHVEFQPGVTPHVNGLGGNTIIMDQNAPLTEWDVQWTIRHEFGHVLGFMDCYVEFYDSNEKAVTNYQLDTKNMMCARSGRMLKTHFDTLKSSYFR